MQFVDTHCHIQSAGEKAGERSTRQLWAKSGAQADELIGGAANAGVTRMICVGCDVADSRLAADFVKSRENCWASVGIHPHETKQFVGKDRQLQQLADLASQPKVVAVGECGLDYHYEHSPKEAQAELLKYQIELALARGLPLIFHVREAFDDFWPIFDSYQGVQGVVHSFTDKQENVQKALERGLYIGVNGIATFTKDQEQLKAYTSIPLDNLLLETDAPFLAPKPYRGQTNEPKYVTAVAEFLANARSESLADIARATTDNARRLFNLP